MDRADAGWYPGLCPPRSEEAKVFLWWLLILTRLEAGWQEVGVRPITVRKGPNLTLPAWVNDQTSPMLTITGQRVGTTA